MVLVIILLLLIVMAAQVAVVIYEICCPAGVQPQPLVAAHQAMVTPGVGVIIRLAGHILTQVLAVEPAAAVVVTVPVAEVSVVLAEQVVSQELL
jgi:hypothetical protein